LQGKGKHRLGKLILGVTSWLTVVGTAVGIHSALDWWPSGQFQVRLGWSLLMSKAVSTFAVVVITTVLWVLFLRAVAWARRETVSLPEPPSIEIRKDQLERAIKGIVRWFAGAVNNAMLEIADEHLVGTKPRRHHRDTIIQIQQQARDKCKEIDLWVKYVKAPSEECLKHIEAYRGAIARLSGANKALSRWFGSPSGIVYECLGTLYVTTRRLSESCSTLLQDCKVTRDSQRKT
jgi:hypothetical protein